MRASGARPPIKRSASPRWGRGHVGQRLAVRPRRGGRTGSTGAARPSSATGTARSAISLFDAAGDDELEHVDLAARDAEGPQRRRHLGLAPAPPGHGRTGLAEQRAAAAGEPVVAAGGEERLRLAQPARRGRPSRRGSRPRATTSGVAVHRSRRRSACVRSCVVGRRRTEPPRPSRVALPPEGDGLDDLAAAVRRARQADPLPRLGELGPGRGAEVVVVDRVEQRPQDPARVHRRRAAAPGGRSSIIVSRQRRQRVELVARRRPGSRAPGRRGRRGSAGRRGRGRARRRWPPACAASSPARAWAPASQRWATGLGGEAVAAAGLDARRSRRARQRVAVEARRARCRRGSGPSPRR